MGVSVAYIAMGSNLGDRRAAIHEACDQLRAHAAAESAPESERGPGGLRLSPVYETAPVGGPADQGPFLNAVAELRTTLPPRDLLALCQRIERGLGRPDRTERARWGPRVLDLDLLFYDDMVIDEPGLRVPHPRLHERDFVLRPLADLAPQLVHPVLGRSVRELLEAL